MNLIKIFQQSVYDSSQNIEYEHGGNNQTRGTITIQIRRETHRVRRDSVISGTHVVLQSELVVAGSLAVQRVVKVHRLAIPALVAPSHKQAQQHLGTAQHRGILHNTQPYTGTINPSSTYMQAPQSTVVYYITGSITPQAPSKYKRLPRHSTAPRYITPQATPNQTAPMHRIAPWNIAPQAPPRETITQQNMRITFNLRGD